MSILTLNFPKWVCANCFADECVSQSVRDRSLHCEECGYVDHTQPPVKVDSGTFPVLRMSLRQAE